MSTACPKAPKIRLSSQELPWITDASEKAGDGIRLKENYREPAKRICLLIWDQQSESVCLLIW